MTTVTRLLSSDIELEEMWLAALPTVLKLERDSGTKDDSACVKMQIVFPWQEEQAREGKREPFAPARESTRGSVSPLLRRRSPTPVNRPDTAAESSKSASPMTHEQRSKHSQPGKTPDAPFRGVNWQGGRVDEPFSNAKDSTHAPPAAPTQEHGDQTELVDAEKPPPALLPNPPSLERVNHSGSDSE